MYSRQQPLWRYAIGHICPVLATAAGVGTILQLKDVTRTEEASSIRPSFATTLADMSPYSPIRILRPNENLEIAFDVRTRNPVYVLERLVVVAEDTRASPAARRMGRPNFYEDSKRLPVAAHRSQLQHYHKSGYDRGHMAPAADFSYDKAAYHDTFTLCNVSPQNPTLNQKDWAYLEEWTRKVARRAQEEEGATTYVVSGPLWLPKRQLGDKVFQYAYPALGKPPSLVAVPSHFFKVVVVVNNHNHQIVKSACFVMANSEPSSSQSRDLQESLVRWTDLEAVSGLQFFPQLVNEAWKAKADRLTDFLLQQQQRHQNNNQQLVLLLTDGTASSSGSSNNSSRSACLQRGDNLMEHLCSRNACRW